MFSIHTSHRTGVSIFFTGQREEAREVTRPQREGDLKFADVTTLIEEEEKHREKTSRGVLVSRKDF